MYHHSILTKAISVVKALTTVNTCLDHPFAGSGLVHQSNEVVFFKKKQ